MRAWRSTIDLLRAIGMGAVVLAALGWQPLTACAQEFGTIFRAGVEALPQPDDANDVLVPQVIVVAGDVHAPGVFATDRESVTARELIERAGGVDSLYEPMVRRLRWTAATRGASTPMARVVENCRLSDSANWEILPGEMLLVVGQRGVHLNGAAGSAGTDASHAVCLGLDNVPVIVRLSAGQSTLNDLLTTLGQELEASQTMVLPVRVDSRGGVPLLEPGTIVMFPPQMIVRNDALESAFATPVPLEPAVSEEAAPENAPPVPEVAAPVALPPSTPTFPTPQPSAIEVAPIPLPELSPGPTASVAPPLNLREQSEAAPATTTAVQQSSLTLDRPPTASEPSPGVESSSLTTELLSSTPADDIVSPPMAEIGSGDSLFRVAFYTGCLAALCLALAGAWSYHDRKRQSRMIPVAADDVCIDATMQMDVAQSRVDHVQELIENRLPIVEEPVAPPAAAEFFGVANGQKRLRLDRAQPLAGPHAPFHTQRGDEATTREPLTVGTTREEASEGDSRLLKRVMAHLAVRNIDRDSERPEADRVEPETEANRTETVRQRENGGTLERALRQVMRKDNS